VRHAVPDGYDLASLIPSDNPVERLDWALAWHGNCWLKGGLLLALSAPKKGNVMSFAVVIGDRIMPSKQGLSTFRSWAGRQGTIIGGPRDENIWVVRWDGRVTIESIHVDFIAPLSSGQMDPDVQDKPMDAKGRRQA
jgi:hypothetical protein